MQNVCEKHLTPTLEIFYVEHIFKFDSSMLLALSILSICFTVKIGEDCNVTIIYEYNLKSSSIGNILSVNLYTYIYKFCDRTISNSFINSKFASHKERIKITK